MNKRTTILKNIAAGQASENHSSAIAPEKVDSHLDVKLPRISSSARMASPPNKHWDTALNNAIADAAKTLQIELETMQCWLEQYQGVPTLIQLKLLRMVTIHGLDPFLDELDFIKHEDGQWQAIISPSGCTRLINKLPTFQGIRYQESSEHLEEIPLWMECSIYRSDRTMPITVREYFLEVKRPTEIWVKMHRRMLRNRTLQQCTKIALGV